MLVVRAIMSLRARRNTSLAITFLSAAASYWLTVWPAARRETSQWRQKARCAPDPNLRSIAIETLQLKWTNIEGAAAFSAFVPSRRRPMVIRALTSWQAAYDLADTLSEHLGGTACASYALHRDLATALSPTLHDRAMEPACDFDQMRALIETAHCSYRSLPSQARTSAAAVRGATRIATYQALYHERNHETLRAWALTAAPPGSQLHWWETSAAAASSLGTLAMIAAAATAGLSDQEANAIEAAHWPWAGALHTLLDSLVDRYEDAAANQPSLLGYANALDVAARMGRLAAQTMSRVELAPDSLRQIVLIAGMTSLYISDANAYDMDAQAISQTVVATIGFPIKPALMMLRLRRRLIPVAHRRERSHRGGDARNGQYHSEVVFATRTIPT
jgi:tetraprenyl-beta-curcumene synthase